MSHQESGRIKHLRLRVPMELYWQLKKDAEHHHMPNTTWARHILCDALMNVKLTKKDYADIDRAIAANWRKIRGGSNARNDD